VDSQPKSSGVVLGRRLLGAILHSSNEPRELSQRLCHDDSTINIVLVIIIIIIIIINEIYEPMSAAVKDIDIADISGQKYRYRIDIGNGDIDPPLLLLLFHLVIQAYF